MLARQRPSFKLPTGVVNGSSAAATASTALNDLASNQIDYLPGDVIQVSGVDGAGQAVSASFTYGAGQDGTTLGDFVDFIQGSGIFPNANVSLGSDGRIQVDSNTPGESSLAIVVQDQAGTGRSNWVAHSFETLVEGQGPDRKTTSITVFDSLGQAHVLTGVFTRQADLRWQLDLSIPGDEGSVSGSPITNISFGPDGAFAGATGGSITLDFSNAASSQTISLELGTSGALDGLTQFGSEATANASSQDGYEAGTLSSLSVTQGGVVQGAFSNGVVIDLDRIGIAQFQNPEGLVRSGSTSFRRSDNSGDPLVSGGGKGAAGTIVSGALEGSNVDTALEFVRLIEAQRSFQGSARVVTTADEVLTELLNII